MRGNRRVAENNFCRFIGHTAAMLQNYFVSRRLSISYMQPRFLTQSFGLTTPNCLMRRSRPVGSQLFKTKSPDHLMAEAAAPERQMKRALTAFDLTCIGIGAIIGTGIFALIGTAIGRSDFSEASIWKTPMLNFIHIACSQARSYAWPAGRRTGCDAFVCVAALPADSRRSVMPSLPR